MPIELREGVCTCNLHGFGGFLHEGAEHFPLAKIVNGI
jgi:hypothetical protein